MALRFHLLGPVAATVDGQPVNLGVRKHRLILALLLLEANRTVPTQRLIDLVWPDNPPRMATATLSSNASRLRTMLARADPDAVVLRNEGDGYRISCDPDMVDVHQFRTLVGAARGATDDDVRAALLGRALDLWRGPALLGVAADGIRDRLAAGLEEARLVAIEDSLDARLRLGQHRLVVDELSTLVAEQPRRHRFAAQLMLALHRSGRTAEALDTYREVRRRLAEELGLDPPAELRDLERAILVDDPRLAVRAVGAVAASRHPDTVFAATGPGAAYAPAGPGFGGGPGIERAGVERPDTGRSAADRAGVERAGVDRAGVERPGVEWAGVERAGVGGEGVERAGPERAGMERPGGQRSGEERRGVEGLGAERPGIERSGAGRPGADGVDIRRSDGERPGMEQRGTDRAGFGGTGAERADFGRSRTESPGAEPPRTEPHGTEAPGTEPHGTEPHGTEPLGTEPRGGGLLVGAMPSGVGPAGAAGPDGGGRSRHRLAQLPPDRPEFTGRDAEVERLVGLCAGGEPPPGVVLGAIHGMAGVGKTALAINVAHRLAPSFPDGQLYIRLHGHSGEDPPVDPSTALARLLRTLGVPEADIPDHAEDRAARYRSELADRRMLIVLDDVASDAQVKPLLPAGAASRLLITSRRGLAEIHGACPMPLDVLPAPAGAVLFRRAADLTGVTAAEHALCVELADLCGGLPLALQLAGARLRHRPMWTLSYFVRRLRNPRHRLGELNVGERSVAAAIERSYQGLTAAQQRLFRLLGRAGREIEPRSAAALAGLPVRAAERLLEDLVDASLLGGSAPGRYHLHELVRLYAEWLTRSEGERAGFRVSAARPLREGVGLTA